MDNPTSPPVKLLLDAREAAAALSISERSLWTLTAPRGLIPVVRVGRAVRYRVADLEQWCADQAKGASK